MIRSILRLTGLVLFFLTSSVSLYAAAPVVTAVAVPPGNYKIGSVITFTIIADGTGYTVDAGTTINGVDVTSTFASAGGNNYTLIYTVASGNTDRASVGAIPINILIRNGAGAGNLNTYTSSPVSAGVTIDANVPTISNVAIPNTAMKVGSVVTATITVGDDGGQTYTLSSGTIGGFTLGGFTRINSTTYEAQFTVTNGGTDVAAGSNIPVNIIIADPATNPSAAYTTAIAQAGDAIDANIPTISNVTIPNSAMKVGSVVTATITVGNDGGQTYSISSGTIGGFTLGSLTRTNSTTYTAQFTVSNGGADVAAGSDIPVSLVIADPATNPSATYNTAISQGTDPIDANIPTVSNVSIPDAAMKIGDVITATITVGDDGGQTYTLSSSTIGGLTLGSFNRTNSTTYTAQFTVLSGGVDVAAGSDIPINIIVADAATNPSAAFTTAISQAGDPIDANNPAVQIVGPLVTTGGTVVANFWNSTNTGINITVPIANSDASLDNGSIQLQANVNGGGFSNVGTASTITNGERVAGEKVFSLTDAEFEAISSTETNAIRFRAIVNDVAGNSSTFTQSALITIDQTAPAALVAAPDLTTATDTEGISGTGTGTNTDNITKSTNPTFTGSGVNGTTVKIFSGATEIGSGSVSGSAYTIAVGAISESVHAITGRVMDAAGNLSAATTPYNVTIDRTPPQIVLKVWNADGPSGNREEIIMTFTELLDMSDALLIANSDGDDTKHGFSASIGGIRDADSKFFSSYTVSATTYNNAIVLRSLSNGNWTSAAVQMRYKDFATASTNANGNNPNYVYDLAGNELVTVTVTASDSDAPKLASGFVLNPNGNGFETIVFRVNETLSQGASVTGFSVNGVPVSGTYDLASTITLTSAANGAWDNTATVSYTAGNVKDGSNNFLAAIPNTPIRLQNITIASNNANTQLAKVGDVITVNFVTSTAPSVTPKVILDNDNVTPALVTGAHPNYQATYTITGANNNGTLSMLIYMLTATDSTATLSTTLPLPVSSSIAVDKTAPITPPNLDFGANSPATQDTGPSSTDNYTATSTNLFFSGTGVEANSTIKLYRAVSTLIGTTTANGAGAWNVTVPSLPAGAYSITATSTDAAGNVSTASSALTLTIDNTTPSVTAITLPSANPNNTTSVNFTVVFDGPVANVDIADFAPYGTASLGTVVSNVIANTSSNYTVTVSGISVLGQLGLNLIDDGTIVDLAANDLGGSLPGDGDFTSPTQYSIVLPEPANHVTSFTIVGALTTGTSMTLTWNDAIGIPLPSGYLITAERSGATAITPPDYTTPVAQQTNLINNTTGYLYVLPGIETATFNSLLSGETYTFRIYSYTNSGTDIDFKTDGVVPNQSGSTPVASNVWINNISPIEPASFPSTTTSSGVAVQNFRLQVYEDAWDFTGDNAPTKITSIKIRRDATDQIGNWNNALAGVELSDGTTTKTGVIDGSGNFITFSGLYNGTTELFGLVPDDNAKYYYIKLILKTSMTGGLPQTVDNKSFIFEMNNADITLAAGSSLMNPSNDTNYPIQTAAGTNKVNVVATQLDFSTDPNVNQLVLTNVTATPIAPDNSSVPVVRARDVNGNTDLNYSPTLTITNTGNLPMSQNTLAMIAGVAAFPSGFQYQDDGNGTLLLDDANAGTTNATSGAITVSYSNTTTIQNGISVATISSLKTSNPYLQVYDFNIIDDNGAGGDGSPTRFTEIIVEEGVGDDFTNWDDALAGAILFDGSTFVFGTIGTNTITFNSINPAVLGFVGDNLTKNYKIWLLLKSAMGGTLPDDVDNKNFVFRIKDVNITPDPLSSSFTGAGDFSSDPSKIAVDVQASKLQFSTNPASVLLVSKDISSQSAIPIVEAVDANNNRDLNYNSATVTTTNSGLLVMSNAPANTSIINGLLTFPNNFQFNTTGVVTLNIASTGPTAVSSATSTSVTVRTGIASTITAGGLSEPGFIASIADDNGVVNPVSGGTTVFDFAINDDPTGTPSTEEDGNPTRIQSISITQGAGNSVALADWTQIIGAAQLSDGNNSTYGVISASSILFGSGLGFPNTISTDLGYVADGASKTYTLKIWLKETLGGTLPTTVDGKSFQFEVLATNIVTNINGTSFISTETENSGTANEIEVTASKIDFTTPNSTSVNVAITPPIIISAIDANGNLDTEFVGAITLTGNTPIDPGPFTTTNDPTGSFSAGQKTYPPNFQFTQGSGDVQLTVEAGAISGISDIISIITSYDSWLYFDPTFTYTQRIDFVNKQEDPITSTSQPLARLILSDGGSAAGIKNQAIHQDLDGSFTKIDAFTISLSNFQDIRKIALYAADGVTKIGTDKTPAATVTFSGLSAFFAPDDGTYTYYIRASFNQTVTDLDQIAMQVTSVTHNSGSKFPEQQTSPLPTITTIAGVDGTGSFGDSSPLTGVNVLDVIATSLDFTTQPSSYAGIDEPLTVNGGNAGIVKSRDQFANLDTEFNYPFAASTPKAGINSSSLTNKFVNGVLDLGIPGMRYSSPGDGTITIEANGISSSVSSSPNKIICSQVDVIHVEGTYTGAGVLTSPNIAGGSVNKVIYGVTFDAPHQVSGGEPSLTKFIISFDNPINVLKSYRVFESRNGDSYDGNDISVTTFGGTVTANNTSKTVTVDFTAVPRDFQTVGDPVNKRLSYFLMVDVEATASGSTLPITPTVIDEGYAFPGTDSNIITSKGSATATDGEGKKFTFASIFPPTLVAANPAVGKLNVDPNKLTIDLAFSVPVWTLDRKIKLYDKTAGTPPITLNAVNGFFDNTLASGPDNVINKGTLTGDKLDTPLSFAIPPGTLIPDHVYYVLIPSGVYNGVNKTGNTGIMDESGNLFQGISYYGTLYFKTANPAPPILLADPSPSITDISPNGATINTTFDQNGKAYFMVVKSTDPMPTNGQIAGRRNDYSGIVIDRGSYTIDKIKPISQFGLTRSDLYNPSTNYNVWIYAENDANPKPIATKGPYGSSASNFAALDTLTAPSSSAATLNFTTGALPGGSGVAINTPTVSICKDSYQFINQPITIYEKTTSDFNAGNVNQVFNLLLPSGYQFDVSLDGTNKPVYGNLTLSGRDAYNPIGTNNTGFVDGFGKLQFINASTLRVTYRNDGSNAYLDDITISGLKIISTTTSNGQIERLGGNALVAAIPDGTAFAKLASSVPEGIDFSNSYSEINFPTNLTAINSIPDNFNEPSLLVTLIPKPPVGDYGADRFNGQGVNVDQLSLASVTLNSPFNITLTHTDNNGCISQNSLQYTIYDHTTAIRDLSIKYGIYNPNFISSVNKSPAPTGVQKDTVFYTNLPAYFMYTVKADTLRGAKQFISGKDWADVLVSLPSVISTTPDPNNTGGADDRFYNTYSLDWATILNAEFNTGNPKLNPYLNDGFRETTNTTYNYEFFNGGSLGIVEFNADYQSIANATVQLPLKQNVEFFLNPIPVVEVYDPSDIDVNDPENLPFTNSNSGPPSNLGTLIFCEGGGKISISGFPKATPGTSKGFFVLIDVLSGDTIYYDHPTNSAKDKLPDGFKDFGSGDAELTPNLIVNGYQDIKISYTYQDDNSPISGSSYQIIRVTPNPKASFNASSILASNNVANVKLRTLPDGRPSTSSSYCEDNLISFNNTAQFLDKNSLPVAGYTAKRNPVWVMGDPLNSRNRRDTITDKGVSTLADSVIFKYSDIGTYLVEFSVESQFGCRSNVFSFSVAVGEIPKPSFDITGLSTATPIVVTNTTTSSIPPNNSITTDAKWNFGDPYQSDLNLMDFKTSNTNTYPTPGHYTITLKATTTAGCEISYQRPVIIVPAIAILSGITQVTDDFESNVKLNQWQTSSIDTLKSSWVRGISKKDSLRLKTNVWITKIKDDYNPNEESYLYSPVYNLSNLTRPMISFDQAANLAKNDGVALEFSVDDLNVADPDKDWFRLGVKGEGTNWYDEAGLASKPGDQPSGDYGWSRKDSSSRSSRHALSPDLPSKNQVAFRFAFRSVKVTGDQGFSIDNFRIGERTRTVLIENFTNKGTTNPDEKAESNYLKDKLAGFERLGAIGDDFIKINYHVGFPGADPFNATNPADPSARALYYNVSKTPTAFLDSFDDPIPLNNVNRLFSKWGETVYGSQSLELAGADITIAATLLPSNTYSVNVTIQAKKDLPASTILHLGFLEAKINSTNSLIKTGETEFEYVLKKLLPSAAGTRFGAPLLKDQTKTFGPFEWTADPAKLFPDTKDDLAVVAFLQDETTKEVHQSELKSGLKDPVIVTGIEAILPEQVNVYPNPASKEFRVELPAIVQQEAKLHLIDMTGRKYQKGMIPSGSNSATVNVEDLSEGIYILEIGAGSTGIVRKKIMIVMKN